MKFIFQNWRFSKNEYIEVNKKVANFWSSEFFIVVFPLDLLFVYVRQLVYKIEIVAHDCTRPGEVQNAQDAETEQQGLTDLQDM